MTWLFTLIGRCCAVIADIMTAAGLIGLFACIIRGLVWLTDKAVFADEDEAEREGVPE